VLTFCDVRRIIDIKFGGRVLLLGSEDGGSATSRVALSDCSSELDGLMLRSRRLAFVILWLTGDEGGEGCKLPFEGFWAAAASLKIWIVSVAEETQRSVLAALKLMLYIRAGMLPLRNWKSFLPEGIAKILMTVPFSDDVAISVPS
jgi:hypothetical protein